MLLSANHHSRNSQLFHQEVGTASEKISWTNVGEALHWEKSQSSPSPTYQQWMRENSHSHNFFEIVVCLYGSHFFGIDGRAVAMRPGSVALIPRGVRHDASYSEHHGAGIDLWLQFSAEGQVLLNYVKHDSDGGTETIHLRCSDTELLSDLKRACSLIKEVNSANIFAASQASSYLLYIIYSLIGKLATGELGNASTSEVSIVENIKQYVGAHIADRLTLNQLARVAGFSSFYFHRVFSQTEGITPRYFIELKRIEHACKLLCEGQSVTSAAYDSGFASCSQFNRVFKKHLKSTPIVWLREKCRIINPSIALSNHRIGGSKHESNRAFTEMSC